MLYSTLCYIHHKVYAIEISRSRLLSVGWLFCLSFPLSSVLGREAAELVTRPPHLTPSKYLALRTKLENIILVLTTVEKQKTEY